LLLSILSVLVVAQKKADEAIVVKGQVVKEAAHPHHREARVVDFEGTVRWRRTPLRSQSHFGGFTHTASDGTFELTGIEYHDRIVMFSGRRFRSIRRTDVKSGTDRNMMETMSTPSIRW